MVSIRSRDQNGLDPVSRPVSTPKCHTLLLTIRHCRPAYRRRTHQYCLPLLYVFDTLRKLLSHFKGGVKDWGMATDYLNSNCKLTYCDSLSRCFTYVRMFSFWRNCKSEICCFPLMGQAWFHFILPDWRLRFRDTESDLANSQLLSCRLFSWTGNPNKSFGNWSVLDGV